MMKSSGDKREFELVKLGNTEINSRFGTVKICEMANKIKDGYIYSNLEVTISVKQQEYSYTLYITKDCTGDLSDYKVLMSDGTWESLGEKIREINTVMGMLNIHQHELKTGIPGIEMVVWRLKHGTLTIDMKIEFQLMGGLKLNDMGGKA